MPLEERGEPPCYEDMRFEELAAALEVLIERMASGDIGIEEATDLYEQAGVLHRMAGDRLASVQRRIDALEPAD